MKKVRLLPISLLMIAVWLYSCGGSGSGALVNNEFLGEYPSLEKQYVEKIEAKEQAIKESTDMDESFKLTKELELLKDEREQKVEEHVAANPLEGKELPFEALDGTAYTIKKVSVNKASSGNLNIKFDVTINEDIKSKYGNITKSLFIYYKAVDAQGNDIPNTTTVATNFKSEKMVAGLEYEVFGSWQTKAIINLENFAKVVEVTKEEYDNK